MMKNHFKIIVLLAPLFWLSVCGSDAYAATCTSVATGNWSAQATWGAAGTGCVGATGGIPGAADTVTIASPNTVTADVALTVATGVGTSLTIASGGTLNIAGLNWTSGVTNISGTLAHTNTGGNEIYTGLVTINSGGKWDNTINESMSFQNGLVNNGTFIGGTTGTYTFTTNTQSIGGTNPIAIATLRVNSGAVLTNTGTLTVSTGLTTSTGSGTFINGANATLNIGGTSTVTTLTATAAGNTVIYNKNNTQTVKATAYYHLVLGGTSAKTMTGVTAIAGDLTVSGSATMTNNATFTVTGALTYSSTGTTTLTAATPISIGSFNQSAGTLIDNGNTITVTGTGAGTWTKSGGTCTPTGTVIFTGAAPQIGASNFNNLTISVGAGNTATLTGNATPAGNLTVTTGTLDLSTFTANRTAAGGTITVANGATLDIGGTNSFPTNYTTHTLGATGTVEYSGANQSVSAEAAPGYGNLTLSGSGTKTAAGSFITRGDLTPRS